MGDEIVYAQMHIDAHSLPNHSVRPQPFHWQRMEFDLKSSI